MARVLDLNALQRPTLDVTMRDEARTVIRMLCPTVGMVEQLTAAQITLRDAATKKDGTSLAVLYEFFAELFSNNLDGITVTAADLRDKYGVQLEDLFAIFAAFLEFVQEVQSGKN